MGERAGGEPRRLQDVTQEAAWTAACTGDAANPLVATFRTLRLLYPHRITLKANEYAGALQLQVDVSDDQVFFVASGGPA